MIEIRLGDVDASAGTCSSWTVESGVKRLTDNCLSSVPKARKRLTASFGSQPLAFRRFPEA